MKRYIALALLVVIAFSVGSPANAAPNPDTTSELEAKIAALRSYISRPSHSSMVKPLSDDEMRAVIDEGIAWLLAAQEQSGHFAYEYEPYEGSYLSGDNIVRQAGALFVLGEVHRRESNPSDALAEGIERAVTFFKAQTINVDEDGEHFACIATSPRASSCKLGATALALAGILGYVKDDARAAKKYESIINDYTAFILASQKPEGGFRDVYRSEDGFTNTESPYSNGEAILALARAYQHEPNGEVKKAIDRAFSYLATTEHTNPLYLWIMAALKDMQVLWPNDAYITYARDFTNWRLATGQYNRSERNYCAFAEGITSAYSVLEHAPLPGELVRLRSVIDPWNAYHRTLQIGADEQYRVLVGADGTPSIERIIESEKARGGFLTAHNMPTQRIDFTQHCVSAYVQTLVDIDAKTF